MDMHELRILRMPPTYCLHVQISLTAVSLYPASVTQMLDYLR